MDKDISEKAISEQDPPEYSEDHQGAGDSGVTEKSFWQRSTRNGTFDDDGLEEYYVPIEKYEGRHRYDPKFEWNPKEEKRVVRKVSMAIALPCISMIDVVV
jgi:hypothetical protein